MSSKTKNLTITLLLEEHEDLDQLVNYFQQQSISTVTKSDVFKYMIAQFKKAVENNKVKAIKEIVEDEA